MLLLASVVLTTAMLSFRGNRYQATGRQIRGGLPTFRWRRADAGTRTPDPLLTMEVLYRLSYVGVSSGIQPSAACGVRDI